MSRTPKLETPSGACDTHMHFYDSGVPPAPGGPPLPGHFTVAMYRELQKRLGLQREWAPAEATRRKIFVDNAAALYGF